MTNPTLSTREREAYSVREVAERYGLAPSTLYKEINAGRLRTRKIGARTIICRLDLDAWLNALPCSGHGQGYGQISGDGRLFNEIN